MSAKAGYTPRKPPSTPHPPPHLWERAPEGGEDVFHLASIFLFLPWCPQLEGIWAPPAPRHIKTPRSKCGEEEREEEERERN